MQQDTHLATRPRLALNDNLTTGTAGSNRGIYQFAVGTTGSYGQHGDRLIGILGTSREESRTLCTETGRVGGVLLVATDNLNAISQTYCCSDAEMRVGGIAAAGGLDSQLHKMTFLGCQLFHLTD